MESGGEPRMECGDGREGAERMKRKNMGGQSPAE